MIVVTESLDPLDLSWFFVVFTLNLTYYFLTLF
jgi:hypothetical protein